MIEKIRNLSAIIFFTCTSLYSQSINLSGKITDSQNGDPLIGANVVLSGNGLSTGAATDFNGEYYIKDIPEGSYQIKITQHQFRDLF